MRDLTVNCAAGLRGQRVVLLERRRYGACAGTTTGSEKAHAIIVIRQIVVEKAEQLAQILIVAQCYLLNG